MASDTSDTSAADNVIKWDSGDDPLAPLSDRHKELLQLLEDEILLLDPVTFEPLSTDDDLSKETTTDENQTPIQIDNYQQFFEYYSMIEEKHATEENRKYESYLEQLKSRWEECYDLCVKIESILEDFSALGKQYTLVSEKTTSLHVASEQLISDQQKLTAFAEKVAEHVKYYKEVDRIMDKLDAPTLSVNSEIFFDLLNKIDKNMDFMQENLNFKESNTYLVKYRHCQSKAITLIQNYICKLITKAAESILNPKDSENVQKNPVAALALFYGRFQSILPKAKSVIEQVEDKSNKRQEFESLLLECHQYFLSQRGIILGPSIQKGLQSIKMKYNGDHCSLVRHSCSLLLHASIDEYRLFYQFFSKPSPALTSFSESLCTCLYDTLRPFIIHINHLETLAEICCILRIEMLDEHVQNNSVPLQGFGNVCLQLLHDVQERLVFRAHLYLQSDVAGYNPSPGDLAYPEKLKMMEDIAESIREENRQIRMKKISLSSMESGGSNNVEPISRTHVMGIDPMYQRGSQMSNSPADLHGMWYPTVRRTLVCLSRLYRCVDRPVFQSLSQEAITFCVQSIEVATERIQARATPLDAELFQVKHLLILREQIAPFQVDFTVKEYSLDFSKVKTAAFSLLEKRSRLFTLSNNALLEFLLEGAPQMKEQLIDSRKHVDAKLKFSCQRLIQHVTRLLIEPVLLLLERSKSSPQAASLNALGNAETVAGIVSESVRLIKFKLPSIQQSMQLYLANRETESILFRPIKNGIVAAFTQLSQLLSQFYTGDELMLIACPLPEQISLMLSSTSLIRPTPINTQQLNAGEYDKSEQNKTNAEVTIQSTEAVVHSTEAIIHSTEAVVDSTQAEIHSTEAEIHSTEAEVHSIEAIVHSTEGEVHSTEAILHSTEAVVHSTQAEIHSTEAEVHSTQAIAHSMETSIQSPETTVQSTDTTIDNTESTEHSNETSTEKEEADRSSNQETLKSIINI